MGNSTTSKVKGIGKLVLKMMWGKKLTLINDVLHVSNILRNIMFGLLLSKNEFKIIFEFNKFVFIKNGVHVGKRYLANGLFKMNVMIMLQDFSPNVLICLNILICDMID